MEIKVSKSIDTEVDITLPYYCKTFSHIYKVYSEDLCIQVHIGTDINKRTSIGIHHSGLAFSSSMIECSKEEFENAFNESLKSINRI